MKALQMDAESFKNIIKEGAKAARGLGAEISKYSSMTVVFNAVKESISAVNAAVQDLSAAYAVQQQAETQLATVMRERMSATESDVQAIKDLCSAQQELGVIGDEVQLAGAKELAAFVSQRATLEALIPVMNNYVAQHAGLKATASDASTAATILGKAMTGNVKAFKGMGITLSDAQKKILEVGTESQKASVLVEIFTAKYGEANKELAKTSSGKLKQVENTLGDIKETLGGYVQGIAPAISILANVTIALAGMFRMGAAIKGASVAIRSFNATGRLTALIMRMNGEEAAAAALKTNGYSISSMKAAVVTKKTAQAMRIAAIATRSAMIISGLGVALAVLVPLLSSFSNNADDAAKSLDKLASAEDSTSAAAKVTTEAEHAATEAGSAAKLQLDAHIKKIKDFNGSKSEEKKLLSELRSTYSGVMGDFKDLSSWYTALTKNSQDYCRQMLIEARIAHYRDQIVKGEAEYKDLTGQDFQRYESERAEVNNYNSAASSYNSALSAKENWSGTRYNLGNILLSIADGKWHPIKDDYDYEGALNSSRDRLEKSSKALSAARSLDAAYAGMEKSIKEASEIKMPVVGTETPEPAGGGGTHQASEQEKTRLQEINALIEAKKQKYIDASDTEKATIQKEISELDKEKTAIETLMASAERPVSFETLKDYDKELDFQNRLLQAADKTQMAGIQKNIDNLTKARAALAASSHTELKTDDIKTFQELDKEVQFYTEQLKTATAEERVQIQKRINELQKLKEKWDEVLENLEKPAPIGRLNNIKDLQKAVQYYNALQQKANGDEFTENQRIINALQKKIDAIQRGASLLDNQTEIDKVNSLQGKEYKVKVRSYGFEELTDKIKELNRQLDDLDNPPTDGQRKMIKDQIKVYEKWRAEGVKSFDTYRSGWTSLSGGVDAINSITAAIEGDGNAWEKTTAIVSAGLQIYDSIAEVVALVDMLTVALGLKHDKTMENVEADTLAGATAVTAAGMEATGSGIAVGAKEAETEASHEKTTANVAEAASGVMAAHASIPWVGIAIGAGMLAVMLGLMAGLPKFADGGIAYGPTLGLFGEYAGASSNPEVVAPLNTLKTLIEPREAAVVGGHVEFEIEGRKLRGVLNSVNKLSSRS